MTTIKLDNRSLLSFDGTTVEFFHGGDSRRAHIGAMSNIQIETDKKGKHWLSIDKEMESGQLFNISDQVYTQVSELVAQIQSAMSSFRADNE